MNRNCNEICDILGIYKIKTQEIPRFFFAKLQFNQTCSPPPSKQQKKTMELYNFLSRIKSNPNMYQANVYMQSKSWVAPWHRFCYTCFNSLNKVFTV